LCPCRIGSLGVGKPQGLLRAATAGDDYELAFTVPQQCGRRRRMPRARLGVAGRKSAVSESGAGVEMTDEAGRAIAVDRPGFTILKPLR